MTEPSAAEFARFVQEAKEQRARADALALALAQLREALEEILAITDPVMTGEDAVQNQVNRAHRALRRILAQDVLAADRPATAGAELLAAIDGLQRRWDAVCRCVDEFEPEDMKACDEPKILLDDAILSVLRARAGQRAAGPGTGE